MATVSLSDTRDRAGDRARDRVVSRPPPRGWPRQLVTFAVLGTANTGVFLCLYLLLRLPFAPPVANVLGTVLTTLAGTIANGRLTFGVSTGIGTRHHLKGLLTTALGLAITTAAVTWYGPGGPVGECLVLVTSTTVAGCVRFALLRHWVFGRAPEERRPSEEHRAPEEH